MDPQVIQGRTEMAQGIELVFLLLPVEAMTPVSAKLL
jgi:hypothetical protein